MTDELLKLSAEQTRKARLVLRAVGSGLATGSALFAVAGALATPWLLLPAGALGVGSVVVFVVRATVGEWVHGRTQASTIGLGADVDATARIEPGATVEMGATVRAGAVVQSGAVVRMGATVEQGATIGSGAVVGWGATVEEGATVEASASVGAGATVRRSAVLASGRHLGAGATLTASLGPARPAVHAAPPDGRAAELEALCDRLVAELQKGSPALRGFLSANAASVEALRTTARDLLNRERALRAEVLPERMARLDQERSALKEKRDAATDAQVKASLDAALSALEAQVAQRALLQRNAERLDAEFTRLRWSIEGMVAQLVSVNAQKDAAPSPELASGLRRVQDELHAVSEALEAVNDEERAALTQGGARVRG